MDQRPAQVIAQALAALTDPPGDITSVADEGSWYSLVTARDGHVVWRFGCEKSAWCLEAAPSWSSNESFDADLLARCLLGVSLPESADTTGAPIEVAAASLVEQLRLLREAVSQSFREERWTALREALVTERQRRNHEMFGGPPISG